MGVIVERESSSDPLLSPSKTPVVALGSIVLTRCRRGILAGFVSVQAKDVHGVDGFIRRSVLWMALRKYNFQSDYLPQPVV